MLKGPSLFLIKIYQRYLRPAFPSGCRFTPSCSEYASQAILKYGFFKGVFKAATRVCSCHPFSRKAGYDPLT